MTETKLNLPQFLFDFYTQSDTKTNSVHESIKARPFVKWVGGKTQLLSSLISRLPDFEQESITTYIEPFVGGGAFLFWILSHKNNLRRIIINDANKALINTYITIRDNPKSLVKQLGILNMEYSSLNSEEDKKAYYYNKREEFNNNDSDQVSWAANFIFLNRTCFNGLYRVNNNGLFNVPHGKYSNPMICDSETIYADSLVLKNVVILNVDFEVAISESDENTFLYLDPPYRPLSSTSSFCDYCEGGFDDGEQIRLASCCKNLNTKGCRWLLSNSDPKEKNPNDSFFDELYAGFNIQTVQASRALNSNGAKRGKLNELLISNY